MHACNDHRKRDRGRKKTKDLCQYVSRDLSFYAIANLCLTLNAMFFTILQIPKYTHSRLTNSGGSGWTEEGKQFFNELQDFVANDRLKHASDASGSNTTTSLTFNKALLQRFQARRIRELKTNNSDAVDILTKKQKPTKYHCIDAFADESDDDDDVDAHHATNDQTLFSIENVTSYEEV